MEVSVSCNVLSALIVLSCVPSELEQLLATQYYSGRLLPCRGSSDIFVPLLKVLDQLLVVGVIQEEKDLRRLLELLDPEQFVPKKTHSKATAERSVHLPTVTSFLLSPPLLCSPQSIFTEAFFLRMWQRRSQ